MELLIKSSNVNRVTASHSEYMVQGGTHTGPKGTPKRMFLEHCACRSGDGEQRGKVWLEVPRRVMQQFKKWNCCIRSSMSVP